MDVDALCELDSTVYPQHPKVSPGSLDDRGCY